MAAAATGTHYHDSPAPGATASHSASGTLASRRPLAAAQPAVKPSTGQSGLGVSELTATTATGSGSGLKPKVANQLPRLAKKLANLLRA